MRTTLVERYLKAQDPYDPHTLAKLRHPDWSAQWPQSGERIPNHEADVSVHGHYPGYPDHRVARISGADEEWVPAQLPFMFIPVRISRADDLWIAEAHLEYPDDGLWHLVGTVEVKQGLVWRETAYFCKPFEAPSWRRGLRETIGGPMTPLAASMAADPRRTRGHEHAFEHYLDTARRDPAAAVTALFHDDAVEEIPQSRERIVGATNIARVMLEHPTSPAGRIRRLVGSGDVLVAELELDYAGEAWFAVEILEFDRGKVRRATEYFAQSLSAPAWRRPWVEAIA